MSYPMLEKFLEVKCVMDSIDEFLTWCYDQNIYLVQPSPTNESREDLLMRYLGIDKDQLKMEERKLLDSIRYAQIVKL